MGYMFMLSVFFWPKQVTWQSLWVFVSQEVMTSFVMVTNI